MDPRLRGRPHAASAATLSSSGFTKPLTFGSSAPAPAPSTNTNNSTAAKFITPLYYSNARTASPASNQLGPLPGSTSCSTSQYPAAAAQQQQQAPQYSAPVSSSTGSAWSSTGFAPPLNFASNSAPAAPAPAPAASVYSASAPNYANPAATMPGMSAIPGMGMLPGAGAGQQPTMASLMAANAMLQQQLQIQQLQMQLQQKQFATAPAPAPAMPALPPLATPMMAPSSTMYSAMAYPSTYETVEKKMKARSAAGLPPRPHAPRANKAPLPGPQVPENAVVTGMPPPPPMPVATSYECDACEKSFSTLDQYRTHTRTHVQCSQCKFAASGRVVKQHEEDMHGIGKEAKEIPSWCKIKLDTPEALAKWIEDRKKRYPTDANIQKKKDEIAAKIARGELLPNGKRPPKLRPERPAKRPRTDADGPAGEGGDDAPDELSTHEGGPAGGGDAEFAPVHRSHRICIYWRRGHCRNGDNCRFRHDPGCAPRGSPAAREAAKKAGAAGAAVAGTRQRRKPLLAKLLEREMHLEHSHILQCLRFMVNNRFFVEGVTWTGQMPAVEDGEGSGQGAMGEIEENAVVEQRVEQDGEDVTMDQEDSDGRGEDAAGADPTLPPGRGDERGDRGVSMLSPPADAGEPEDGEIEEGEVGSMDEVIGEASDAVAQPLEEEGAIMVDLF